MAGILFIDAEQPFANQTADALRGRGFAVTILDDGKDGLDAAARDRPDLIVLCVELPKMSGYSICNKLKKDNDLKGIPLIITSKEATPETFAQHKKLKTRAEDYLIKPFSSDDLVEKIGALGVSAGGASALSDGMASLEDLGGDLGGDLGIGDADLGSLDALSPPSSAPAPSLDDDSLSGLGDLGDLSDGLDDALAGELEMPGIVKDAAAADLDAALDAMAPELPPRPAFRPSPSFPAAVPRTSSTVTPSTSVADLQALQQARREASEFKAKIAELEARLRQAEDAARAASTTTPPTSASSAREVLTLKQQLRAKDDEILAREGQIVEVQEQLEAVHQELAQKSQEVGGKDIEISTLRARVDVLTDQRDQLEQQVQGRLGEAEAERDAARAEVEGLRQETDSLRAAIQDAGARADELARSLDDTKRALDKANSRMKGLEADMKDKEQDAMKAYQLLKSEEQLREKARQAAELAVKLLRGDVDMGGGTGLEA